MFDIKCQYLSKFFSSDLTALYLVSNGIERTVMIWFEPSPLSKLASVSVLRTRCTCPRLSQRTRAIIYFVQASKNLEKSLARPFAQTRQY